MKNAHDQSATHPDGPDGFDGLSDLDTLIDALLDATLTGAALADLAQRVAQSDTACERFEHAMHAQRVLASGASALDQAASNVALPTATESTLTRPRPARRSARLHTRPGTRATFIRRAGAIAAVLSLVASSWVVSGRFTQRDTINTTRTASTPPIASTAQSAFANYMRVGMDEGRIIRELPPVTIELKKTGSGTDVVFVRRLLERARVDDVYRVGQDESGRSIAVPMDLAALAPGQSL